MRKAYRIQNTKGINWNRFEVEPEELKIGEIVVIEDSEDCPFSLWSGEYYVTFENAHIFSEEVFTVEECKILVGESFNMD